MPPPWRQGRARVEKNGVPSTRGGTSLSGAKGVIYEATTPFVPQGVPPNSLTHLECASRT